MPFSIALMSFVDTYLSTSEGRQNKGFYIFWIQNQAKGLALNMC